MNTQDGRIDKADAPDHTPGRPIECTGFAFHSCSVSAPVKAIAEYIVGTQLVSVRLKWIGRTVISEFSAADWRTGRTSPRPISDCLRRDLARAALADTSGLRRSIRLKARKVAGSEHR